MFNFLKKKAKEVTTPKTTTLEKYHIHFKTIDGVEHICTHMCYADPSTISCSIGNYYLIGEKFLRDDDDVQYPMCNVVSIRFELVNTLENVIQLYQDPYSGWRKIWYRKKDIEIYNEKGVDK